MIQVIGRPAVRMFFKKKLFVILITISIIYGLINHLIIMKIFNNQLVHCLIISVAFGVLYYLVVLYIFRKNMTLVKYNRTLELKLNVDELTQLYNRKALEESLVTLEFAESYSMIFIDIDNFKSYNDNYGHEVGDEVLKGISEEIKNSIRSIDRVYRYGGEEVLVILERCDYLTARGLAEKIKLNVSKLHIEGAGVCTVSLGVGSYPENGRSPREIIKYADSAMLNAKKKGKNQVS